MSVVNYLTPLPTGLSVAVLNNNDVVLSIEGRAGKNPWAGYQAFLDAKDVAISMVSTSDSAKHDTANDLDCLVMDAADMKYVIRDFVLTGLAVPQTHTIHISITYGATNLYYSTEVNILGAMEVPVVKSAIISAADPNTAIVEVLPHKKSSDVSELKRADLEDVIITATSKKDTKVYKFAVNDTGLYDFPTLSFGETYKFYAVMTNKTFNKVVSAANNLSLYIVDASAFPASKLSAPIKDGSVFVTIAPIVIPDVKGTDAQIVAQRPLKIKLLAAKVPTNILDVSKYEPADAEYILTKTFSTLPYDSTKKETTFAGDKFEINNMTGLTLKYKAAFMYVGDAEGSYCAVQSVSVDAASIIAAPNTYASAAEPVTGLQLVGYEYSIVKDDKTAQPKVIGKWSLNDDELIIAGSKTASSITVSAFNGITTSGLTTRPTVGLRLPTIAFEHDKMESPYYRITKRAVYAKVGDFSWANFTASGTALARAKLTLSGSDLKIDGKQWLVATKANIKSEWKENDVEFATVLLADCAQPSVDIALVENKVMATFTVSEVKSHLDFVAKGQFTNGVAADLKYYIINNTSGLKSAVARDINDKLTVKLEILRGSKNYYSVLAEATRGVQLVGASAALPLPNLHIIPGENRALAGSYACDPAEIKSGVLAHAAGVGASFAITYDGRFSYDQDVKDFADDHLYSADYQMSGVQSYDVDTEKWSDVAGATIARFSPTDAEGKAILKTACFRITGVAGLKSHRVLLARHYALKSDATVKIADKLPVYLGFMPTISPNAPVFAAKGSEKRVDVVFANGVADSALVLARPDLTNDLWIEGIDGKMALTGGSSDTPEFFKSGLSGSFVYVAGARSYTNPNATVGSMILMDGPYVSSALTARVHANIEAGVAALTGHAASTVYTAEVKAADATVANPEAPESYRTKFECNAPAAAGVNAEVVVFYNEAGVDKDISKSYQLAKDKSGKFSYSLDPNQLRMDLGLTADKFMAANLKCLFIASKEYSQSPSVSDLRRSIPVSVNYTPKMKPTLQASDFSVKREAGKLTVTTGALSKVQLGGNASLDVKVLAKSEAGTFGVNDVIVITSGGLSKELNLGTAMYEVSVVIQSMAGLVGETTLVIGNFVPKDQLLAAESGSFKVIAGAATSSLDASWKNLAANELGGWALSTRRIYVSNIVSANKTLYYVASGNATITADIRTAYKSTSALTETLSGLPVGITFTVELETVYVKTGESPLIVKAEATATCASAPVFQSFLLDKDTNIVTAVINQNGAQLTNFWLFAKYDGAQGKIYFDITIPATVKAATTKNHQFDLTLPSGVKPSGVMGILVNSNGAVTAGSPALTFGAPAGGSNSTADGIKVVATLA